MQPPTPSSSSHPHSADPRIALAVGLLLLSIYLTTTALRFQSIDEVAIFAVTRSLIGHGGLDADSLAWRAAELGRSTVVTPGADGHYYGVKDILPSLLIAPLAWLGRVAGVSPVRAALLLSPLATALTGSLLYTLLRDWRFGRRVAVGGSLIFGLCSLSWVYAETLFTQPLAALGLTLALYATVRARRDSDWRMAALAGLGLGLAAGSSTPTGIALLAHLIYLLPWGELTQGNSRPLFNRTIKLIMALGLGMVPLLALAGALNAVRFGGPLRTGNVETGIMDRLSLTYLGTGLFGLLFSTPRGLIWYAPFVALIPFGWRSGWQRQRHRREMLLALGQVGLVAGFYSLYDEWWGGLAWGPRFLASVMPALAVLVAPVIEVTLASAKTPRINADARTLRARPHPNAAIATFALLFLSFATQLAAALFNAFPYQEALIFQGLQAISPPPHFMAIDPFLLDPRWLPWPILWAGIRAGEWDALWLATGQVDGWLLVASLMVVALAVVWLRLATGDPQRRLLRAGLAIQGVLNVGLAALMLARYPAAPGEFLPRQSYYPPDLDLLAAATTDAVEPGDGVIAVLPYGYLRWLDAYAEPAPDYGLPLQYPLDLDMTRLLEKASGWHDRLWLATEIAPGDPLNGAEGWLADHGYPGSLTWAGGYRLIPFTFARSEMELSGEAHVFGRDEITLTGWAFEWAAGQWVNVWLRWGAGDVIGEDYVVTVQLIDSGGTVIAQHDGPPHAGLLPTSGWRPGQSVDDRHSLPLSGDLPPGTYRLIVALYRPADRARLPLADGSGDVVVLLDMSVP